MTARYHAAVDPLPPLTVDVIDAFKAAGLTQSDVARLYGVTRAAVSAVVRRHGGKQTPRQIARSAAWPWTVPARLQSQRVCRYLRDHLEFVSESMLLTGNLLTGNIDPGTPVRGTAGTESATSTSILSWRQLRDLRSFYSRMKDRVIEFDPDLPPSEGVSVGGFAYRQRVPADADLLIRVNDHTVLTDDGRGWWRMPAVLPDPVARYRYRGKA